MGEYQIRITRMNGETAAYSCHCVSVFAAVRRAKSIGSTGDVVEVWSGMACVFSDLPHIAAAKIDARDNENS